MAPLYSNSGDPGHTVCTKSKVLGSYQVLFKGEGPDQTTTDLGLHFLLGNKCET